MAYPLLKLTKVSKRLSDYFSLKDIDFELDKGEVHVLVGENGSGKSSLMNIICGFYQRDKGDIFINNVPVSFNSPMDAKKYGISMIHQDSTLFEHFTVAENIYMDNKPYINENLKIIDWERMFSNCKILFNNLGFNLNGERIVKNLSTAEKQIVEICRAYVSNTRIIIMDEPTSSLTMTETLLLFNIIKEMKKSGVAVIYITHKLEEIKKVGDKITVIRDGEIIGTEYINSMDVDNILYMMAGMSLDERYPKLKVKLGKEVLKVVSLSDGNFLEDINFFLRKREVLGIFGLVGSGKTKISKSILGLNKIDSGEIYIEGKKTNITSPSAAIKSGIGCVTEDRYSDGLFMYRSVSENITAPSLSKVSNHLLIDKKIENDLSKSYIERLEIKINNVNEKVADISGGNQQKVVLAKWIMSKSKILILDEPTKGIDIASKLDLYNIMNEMVTKDVSIILISSDIDEVIGMCDRIIVLYNGKIAGIVSKCEASHKQIMSYATCGKKM
jgi:ABC-type sugar transport system ATPase subunit